MKRSLPAMFAVGHSIPKSLLLRWWVFLAGFLCFFGIPGMLNASRDATASSFDISAVFVDSANGNISRDLAFTRTIFNQLPIGIHLASIQHSNTLPTTLVGTFDPLPAAFNDPSRYGNLNTYLEDNTWQPFPLITVWYVPHLITDNGGLLRGISFENGLGQIGMAVSDLAANDTFAHELAHILMDFVDHDSDPNHLLASGAIRNVPEFLGDVFPNGAMLDEITASQATTMLASAFVVPEPPIPSLLVVGLLCLGLARIAPTSLRFRFALWTPKSIEGARKGTSAY